MISATEIRTLLLERTGMVGNIIITNQQYSLPDSDYMKSLGKRFHGFLRSSSILYTENAWECDNYAMGAALFARVDHALTSKNLKTVGLQADPPERTAIAVGMIGIMQKEGGAHAINFTVQREGKDLKLCLYEPQQLLKPYDSRSVEYYLFAYL